MIYIELKNRIKKTESDILKLQSEYRELLNRMDKLENGNGIFEKTTFVKEAVEYPTYINIASKEFREIIRRIANNY